MRMGKKLEIFVPFVEEYLDVRPGYPIDAIVAAVDHFGLDDEEIQALSEAVGVKYLDVWEKMYP